MLMLAVNPMVLMDHTWIIHVSQASLLLLNEVNSCIIVMAIIINWNKLFL